MHLLAITPDRQFGVEPIAPLADAGEYEIDPVLGPPNGELVAMALEGGFKEVNRRPSAIKGCRERIDRRRPGHRRT